MKLIQGKAHEQAVIFPTSIDHIIAEDNEYIDGKLAEYQLLLDECSKRQKKEDLEEENEKQNRRRAKHEELEEKLSDVRIKQIKTSDPDSSQRIIRNNITPEKV